MDARTIFLRKLHPISLDEHPRLKFWISPRFPPLILTLAPDSVFFVPWDWDEWGKWSRGLTKHAVLLSRQQTTRESLPNRFHLTFFSFPVWWSITLLLNTALGESTYLATTVLGGHALKFYQLSKRHTGLRVLKTKKKGPGKDDEGGIVQSRRPKAKLDDIYPFAARPVSRESRQQNSWASERLAPRGSINHLSHIHCPFKTVANVLHMCVCVCSMCCMRWKTPTATVFICTHTQAWSNTISFFCWRVPRQASSEIIDSGFHR